MSQYNKYLLPAVLWVLLAACQPAIPVSPAAAKSPAAPSPSLDFPAEQALPFTAKDSQYLRRWDGRKYQNFYIKGVNLGVGVPGTVAGDLAATREQYARWFQRMGELGINSLRIYTLHFPLFYEELARYNAAHADQPIYLFHGIWLDENERNLDLYKSSAAFDQAITEVVDAVHGKLVLDERRGKAFGTFRANISRWVMGWILAREISPEEVQGTNRAHPERTVYSGKNLKLQGTPAEVWFSERLDRLISYERDKYKVERPFSVSSWPTLDPLKHVTESEKFTSEDVVSLDFAQMELSDAPAGYFASFHAYPYYPDFMVDDPVYQKARDEEGPNNYLGYLKDLKKHYRNMPLVIAEYGVPSSWGNAHFSPSGMHHGGHDEEEQGRHNARQTRTIHASGAAGGMLFAWIDEWWKRTWIVDEQALPRDRYRLWHNLTSPEQNFGLIAFDYGLPQYQPLSQGSGRIQSVQAAADVGFFHLRVSLDAPLTAHEQLVIGYDTYARDQGAAVLPNGVQTQRRHEFALTLQGGREAQLLVTRPYDLFGIWHDTAGPQQIFRTGVSQGAPWQPVRWQNGQEHTSRDADQLFPITIFPIGQLKVRQEAQPASSLDAVRVQGNQLDIRLPWTLLQFTDPSTRSVMHDDRNTRGRETTISEGIAMSVTLGRELVETEPFRWEPWEQVPATVEREKAGARYLQEALKALPEQP